MHGFQFLLFNVFAFCFALSTVHTFLLKGIGYVNSSKSVKIIHGKLLMHVRGKERGGGGVKKKTATRTFFFKLLNNSAVNC